MSEEFVRVIMKKHLNIYLAWVGFQRRQVSMESYCNFTSTFLPTDRNVSKLGKLLIYITHGWRSIRELRKSKPDELWIQLPQVPLLWVALFYKYAFSKNTVIIADCHNAMFRPPWSKVPFGVSLLSRCDVVLAHNSDVMEVAASLGVDRSRLMVVEDPPASLSNAGSVLVNIDLPRPWFVFPASFAADEPIAELLAAAAQSKQVSILITGNLQNCKDPTLIDQAPTNVRFLGYLERNQFESLITGCDAVIAFTRHDGIQLSVCGEAVGGGKPMLASDTSTLRRLFSKGTVFVDSQNSESIAKGIHELIATEQTLAKEMILLRESFIINWLTTRWQPLRERIRGKVATNQSRA